ncbi:MAG: hypothetical protein FJ261_00215 [Planctomycetes bacterium]|nr:hypothetical protein [Planctomycetota bacterium]
MNESEEHFETNQSIPKTQASQLKLQPQGSVNRSWACSIGNDCELWQACQNIPVFLTLMDLAGKDKGE